MKRLYTRNTSVTLPPGVFARGRAYVLFLEALSFSGDWLSFTPPMGIATISSGVIRP